MDKIYKLQAKSISKMTTEEIEAQLISPQTDVSTKEAIVQEGLNKLSQKTFWIVANTPELLNNPKIYEYSLSYLSKLAPPDGWEKMGTFAGLFTPVLNSSLANNYSKNLLPISLKNTNTSAIALMEAGTPKAVVNSIINMNRLNIPSHATIKSPILSTIISMITETNMRWDNTHSAMVLLTRLIQNPSDMFIIAASKQNLGYDVASVFLSAGKHYSSDVVMGLRDNVTAGVRMAFSLHNLTSSGINSRNLNDVIDIVKSSSSSTEFIKAIWDLVINSINNIAALTGGNEEENDPLVFHQIFAYTLNGESLVDVMVDKDVKTINNIIDLVKKNEISEKVLRSHSFTKLVHIGLNDASTKNAILSLPEEWFNFVSMTPNDRIIIADYFHPKQQNVKIENVENVDEGYSLEDIIGSKKNWYKKYSSK